MRPIALVTLTRKQRLYQIIFGTQTKAGRNFDIALIVAILCSELILILSTIRSVDFKYSEALTVLEWVFTILFTIEYALRLYCSPKPWAYARSFYGVIDLIAVLPSYLAFLIPGSNYLLIVRLIRVMRIFRILKLARFLKDSNILLRSLLMHSAKYWCSLAQLPYWLLCWVRCSTSLKGLTTALLVSPLASTGL